MCGQSELIERSCGLLLFNEFNIFIYYCKSCSKEFASGSELESHILLGHGCIKTEIIYMDENNFEESYEIDPSLINEAERTSYIKEELTIYDIVKQSDPNDDGNTSPITNYRSESENHRSRPELELVESTAKPHIKYQRNKVKRTYYCDMCPQVSFNCKGNLRIHLKRHIKESMEQTRCKFCNEKTLNYRKHMKLHRMEARPYKCVYCGAAFKQNGNRVIHMRTHTGERPFLCPTCGKSFKCQTTRQRHELRVHVAVKPYPCRECKRTFCSPSQLKDHQYAFHSGERPYVCDVCGKNYSTKSYLTEHKHTHGERKHPCKYCGKLFKTSGVKRFHERKIHENEII